MNDTFDRFVTSIINEIDGSKNVKSKLRDNLLTELNDLYESFIQEGYGEREAEEKALTSFGDKDYIIYELQQKHNPFQRPLLFTLALSSIIYTVLTYLGQLYIEGEASIGWLVISMSVNVILLLFVYRVIKADRKWFLNSMLTLSICIYVYGLGIVLSIDHSIVVMLFAYSILLILLSITLIYLHIIFHWDMTNREKWVHLYNISLGIIIIVSNLFLLILLLIFTVTITFKGLLVLIPTIIWILFYVIQIQLIKRQFNKLATVFAFVPLVIVIWFIIIYFFS